MHMFGEVAVCAPAVCNEEDLVSPAGILALYWEAVGLAGGFNAEVEESGRLRPSAAAS